MATWHQQQAQRRAFKAGKPIVFWHETQWTVLCDPLNGMTSLMRFATQGEAETYLANLKRNENAAGCLVLPPAKKG